MPFNKVQVPQPLWSLASHDALNEVSNGPTVNPSPQCLERVSISSGLSSQLSIYAAVANKRGEPLRAMLLLPEGARGLYSQHSNSMSEKTKPLARVTQGSVQDGTAGPWLSCRFSFFWSRASLKMSNGIWGIFYFFTLGIISFCSLSA